MCDPRTRPSFIPAPGVGKFVLMVTQPNGDTAENIIHVHHKDDSAWSETQLRAMAVVIANSWTTNIAPWVNNGFTLAGIRVTDLTTLTGPSVLQSVSSAGTNTNEALPGGCTFAVKLSTGLRGRSYRGRVFFIGLCDVRSAEDTLTPAYVTAIQNGWNAILASINGVTNCEMVVTSYCNSGNWRNPAVSTPVTVANSVDPFIDYQRRRATAHAVHR